MSREKHELMTDLVLEVFRLNGALLESGNALVKELNLTSARWQVLGAIALADENMTVPKIGQAMGLTRQSVQRLVNEMKKDGLLTLQPNVEHKRSPIVALTPKGQEIYDKAMEREVPWAEELATELSAWKILEITQLLHHVRTKLET